MTTRSRLSISWESERARNARAPPRRILYALGPGDAVHAFREWSKGREVTAETSITYSSQFFDYCLQTGTEAFAVSSHPRREVVREGIFVVENRPKRFANAGGALYHISQLHYAASILWTALCRRPDAVIVDSGTTHWFLLAPLRIARIPLIASLHNVLWAPGFPPLRPAKRLLLWLAGWFWRHIAQATICVSPECERQVHTVAGKPRGPVFQHRAQFRRSLFESVAPRPPHELRPFRILFVGRVEANKGVFDLVAMAERLDFLLPGQFEWHVCGDGSASTELARQVRARGLDDVVFLLGKLDQGALRNQYGWAHLLVVPTRSEIGEGLSMAAAEAVLAGRPVVSSSVTPAIDVLGDAFVAAQPDDVESYVAAIRRLAEDGTEYARRAAACTVVQQQFLDPENGLRAALARAIASLG
jgi:glycogen(starch) synthase